MMLALNAHGFVLGLNLPAPTLPTGGAPYLHIFDRAPGFTLTFGEDFWWMQRPKAQSMALLDLTR